MAFYKLSASSYRSMGNMRRLQPKIQALKEQMGGDKQKFGQEMMALYRKEKIRINIFMAAENTFEIIIIMSFSKIP